jgi:molecular chaperone GrpE
MKKIGKTKAREYLDGWKRSKADFENFKKEAEKQIKNAKDQGKIEVLRDVLPVIDGLGLVIKGLENSLGLEEVETKKFNPEVHEAIGGEGESIESVLSKGYKLNGKLVRAAKVKLNE